MLALTASPYVLSLYAVPVGVTAVIMLAAAAGVLVRRPSGLSFGFSLLALSGAVWLFAFVFLYSTADAARALAWARLAYLGVPIIPSAVYHFTVDFLRIHRRRRFAVINAYVIGATFAGIAVFTDLLIPSVTRYWWGFYPRYRVSFSIPFLIFFFGYLGASFVELFLMLNTARGVERKRIHLLLTGFAIACIGCVDFLPKYGIGVYPFGFLAILGFVAIVMFTVIRYDIVAMTPSFAARQIIGTMADALFVCDSGGTVRSANQAAAGLLGYQLEDLPGTPMASLVAQQERLSATLVNAPAVQNSEFMFLTKTGERIELSLSIAPVMQEREAAGFVIIGRDMRERKRAEREILQAVTLLESTLESTADGILVIDSAGHIVSYNQRFLEMWDLTPEVMERGDDRLAVQQLLYQVVAPDDFLRTIDELEHQPTAESFDIVELRDGRRFERYSIGREIAGSTGIRVWSFRDVTARFAAEAALRESETRYRLLFEQNAAGVCVTRVDGTIVDCNVTFASTLGRRRVDLISHNIRDLYARPDERDEMIGLLRDSGSLRSVEVEMRRVDGTTVWVLQNLVFVGLGDSAVVHATVVDISDRKRAEEQIEFHAFHDVLTLLPNRKLFVDRLMQNLARARRSGKPLAVLFIDLDQFKSVNDTLGHTAGDELLLEMSKRLRRCTRGEDTVARLGGDEFTIILSELHHVEDALTVAGKILELVSSPLTIGSVPIEISASIGIALYPADGSDPETLLRNADSAMYRAKESGRNTFQLCTDEMKRAAMERLSLETRLRKAIHDGALVLHYQPQISFATGRIVGAEALVRWPDPEMGFIEPSVFIPIAEESRLIVPLGDWVLRNACVQAHQWARAGSPIRVAVNLSVRQFQQQDLVDRVRAILDETQLAPSALELEITETAAMQNADVTISQLRALRKVGVGISIDDFGTGYSSLNYLKNFPITAVKIDRSFVRDLATSEGDAAIVSAVIGIARSLQLRVIAEGVETDAQFEFLHRRACDEAQGYYFSRPVGAEVFLAMLREPVRSTLRQPRLTV
jgi:diguanylate cyclase (GGDEF)-like protein/PAS domain S-box-containing protein